MIAENNIKNALSTFCLFNNICNYVKNPNLIVNFDATQFTFNDSSYDLVQVLTNSGVKLETYSTSKDFIFTSFGLRIKYFAIITASGLMCPTPVYILADSSVEKGKFNCYEVNGLSLDIYNPKGYICFCNTRAGNTEFFLWFNNTVLLPFMKKLLLQYGDTNSWCCLICDGEYTQIQPYFTNNIIRKLSDIKCIIGKLAALTTGISQPCDCYNLFKATKTILKSITDGQIVQYKTIKDKLDEILDQQNITGTYKTNIIKCILKIITALLHVVGARLIQKSFEIAGFSDLNDIINCNYNKIFQNYSVNLTTDQASEFDNNKEQTVQVFAQNGNIKDDELKHIFPNIINDLGDPNERSVDTKVIMHKRCMVLNHTSTLQYLYNECIQKEKLQLNYNINVINALQTNY